MTIMIIFIKRIFVVGLLLLSYSCKEKDSDLELEEDEGSEVEAFKISNKESAVQSIKNNKLYTDAVKAVKKYRKSSTNLNKIFPINDIKREHKLASLLLAVHNEEAALKIIKKKNTKCYIGLVSPHYQTDDWALHCEGAFKGALFALNEKASFSFNPKASISSNIKNTLRNYNGSKYKERYSDNAIIFYEYFAKLKPTDLQ